MMKRVLIFLLVLMLLLPVIPIGMAAEIPAVTTNMDGHWYISDQRWADPIHSHLAAEGDGYVRVENTGSAIVIEQYDRDFRFVSGRELALELPVYGGVYLGAADNFVVVGQQNPNGDDTQEVIRIIRYSKSWVRQGSASLYGANTVEPFRTGSLRFDRCGGMLYIRTSHSMYADENGVNHQANMMIALRVSDMTITDTYSQVMNPNYGYVSHSFNQFVRVDGTTLVTVDHGDAYPRSVVLMKYPHSADSEKFSGRVAYVEALPIAGPAGDNDTGVSVGGFECSATHYLIAGNSAEQLDTASSRDAHRNIFVTATPKDPFTNEATAINWITCYTEADGVSVSPPHLLKLSSDRFFLVWTENRVLRYCFLNGRGEKEGQIYRADGALSDCHPVLKDNRIVWYVTDSSEPVFYIIDLNDPGTVTTSHAHVYSAVTTAPTCTEQGYTTHTCRCGDSYKDGYADALGHDYAQGKCSRCGEPDPEHSTPSLISVIRLSGKDRYQTAFVVADQMKENLGIGKFEAAVVAYGKTFPDALAGSYLAAVKKAPILLTEPSADASVLEYIGANVVPGGKVYILGGSAAVSEDFENIAKIMGFDVNRLKGSGRYETNLAILKEAGVNAADEVLIATGANYADSLSASATGLPMLLVGESLTAEQRAFLWGTSRSFVIIGGTGAVSETIEAELAAIGTVVRVKGASRYETSVAIAERYFISPRAAVLAYAGDFPDGLCGGPLAVSMGAPMILTSSESFGAADDYLEDIVSGAVTGGTGRISDDAVREIFDLAPDTEIPKL